MAGNRSNRGYPRDFTMREITSRGKWVFKPWDNYCQHGEKVVILQYTRKGYGHPLLCLRYASVVALLS